MVKTQYRKLAELATLHRLSHIQFGMALYDDIPPELLDDHRVLEPPDPIPNSVVKRHIADGSVGFPHVRVGHRQACYTETPRHSVSGGFAVEREKMLGCLYPS